MMAFEFLTELKGDELKGIHCLVTGGCGFLGSYLVRMILDAGAAFVTVLDAKKSPFFSQLVPDESKIKLVLCDVRNKEQVHKAAKGVDIVFHAAAYFGFPALSSNFFGDHQKVLDVNINGTSNVLQACIENDVKSLIYTSSVNVVFDGVTPINKGDEKMPYTSTFRDPYGFAKAKAERDVIGTNGKYGIATCSLRPNGIYGPGEMNNVGRMMMICHAMGGLYVSVGALDEKKAVSDWTYVENIAHSNILAAIQLLEHGTKSKIAGQCYNITDGVCYNNVEFFKDFLIKCGLTYNPCIAIPPQIMLPVAKAMELFCYLVRPIRPMQPIIMPLEVGKVVTSHHFSIEKAKADLNYKPLPIERCRELTGNFYVEFLKNRPSPFSQRLLPFLLSLILAIFFTLLLRFVFGEY
eukprot:Phypoly_transcript_07454.p1 GENE.Phypoly_transcript_07454~~Phypoly_transcript_07454.p1  ORF type:complete len:408 (-),score=50.39 Phypoly_transcript_07454:320-1543(-)